MLDAIRSLFSTPKAQTSESTVPVDIDPVHLAACSLLLEVAHADGEFSTDERAHLEQVLERHFALPPSSGQRLIELAEKERRGSIDHFQFTRVINDRYDIGQKMVLAEVMWGLVLADGQIAEHEHYLTRKIANLLELEPGYLSTAKARAAGGR
jgi:uncharacterized tellurite resistance protein B-like protein